MHRFLNTDTTARGIAALADEGYDVGDYNPHDVRAWLVYTEFGERCIVTGAHEQEALDNAADSGALDIDLMSDEHYQEYSSNGWDDSYIHLGNDSAAYWCECLGVLECANTNDNTIYQDC
tara:strand:+ start:2385 stop:2744 length:360 start_codon:yes stop_codon:yes gene_type:complete